MEDWENNKLGDIIELVYGKSLPKSKRKVGTVPVYGSNGIVGYHNEAIVNEPGIIVGRKGSAGNVKFSTSPFCPIDTTFYITQEHTKLDLSYLFYALEALNLKRILGDVGVPGLNREMAYLEELEYPETRIEQHKIAYVLGMVQKAIEKQGRLIKATTELKKALMQKLFTEGLHGESQKETDFGYSPESWKVQPFENTGEVVYGIQAAVANNLKPIGKKILTNKNITLDGRINLEKLNYFELSTKRHFQTILQKGDLLFNWRSGSKEHVGKTALFDLTEGEYTHSSFILRIRVNEKHHSLFLYYYLNFLRETGYYQKVQTYSINAKFNKSAINAMPIALPDKDEQIKIAEIISTIDKKLDNSIAKKKANQDMFKTLLQELMTRQRRVHELEFEGMVREYKQKEQPLSIAAED